MHNNCLQCTTKVCQIEKRRTLLKKFLSSMLIITCLLCAGLFSGCGGGKSADEVNALFSTVCENYTKNSFLSVSVDSSKVVSAGTLENDKAYIFPLVCEKYMTSASGFVFDVARRQNGKLVSDTNGFSNKQCGEIYTSLEAFSNSLNLLKEEIQVFEKSSGNLHYKELIEAYNNAVGKAFDLTSTYSSFYLERNVFDFSSTEKLTNTSVRDMVWLKLCSLAKVSFEYEVLNQTYELPYGEVQTWYNGTVTVKDVCNLASSVSGKFKNSLNVASRIQSSYLSDTQEYLLNLLQNESKFTREYSLMKSACAKINVKEYLSFETENDKKAYVATLSYSQQSCVTVIENFLQERFAGVYNGLTSIMSKID